jgi:PAS domain-containing protein
MAGKVETAWIGQKRRELGCCVGLGGFYMPSPILIGWVRRAAWTIPLIAVSASVLAMLCLVQTLGSTAVHATAFAAIGLAGLGIIGCTALRTCTALSARLEILVHALDAVPEAQAVVGRDGRVVYANVAFQRLFPAGANLWSRAPT